MTGQQGRRQGAASEETRIAITNMITEVRLNDLVKQDWTKELSSAPMSVAILGECMLVASFKNAAQIQLDHPKLRSKYLAPNLLEIAQVGSTTFINAELGMGQICASSQHVGGLGGTIDNIMEYSTKPKTPIIKKLLGNQLNVLKKKSETCAGEAQRLLHDFEKWGSLVDKVFFALSDKSADSLREEREKAQELVDQMKKEADLVAAQERSQRNLELRKQKLFEATATRQKVDNAWQEHALFITGVTVVNPLLGWTIFGLTTLGLWATEYDFLNEEQLLEAQRRDLEKTLLEEKRLAIDLQKLRDDNTSLAEIKKTLSRAMGRLGDLTQCIRQMLLFFGKVTKMVDNIVEHQDDEFVPVLQIEDAPESEDDPEVLRQATQNPAFRAKVHFATMQKIAEAYTDISNEYIVGGFDEILKIGLSNICENDEEVNGKQTKLDALKRKSSQDVRATVQQRQKELYASLQSLVEKCAHGVFTKQIEN